MDEGIMELDVLERIFDGSLKPTGLKLSALQSITENFSEERIIGTGGFGTVYKGVLRNGEVAVKRIKSNHTIDEKLYRREVNSLLQVSHKNIVRFLGFCSHTEHKVFEKGSRDYIYVEDRERILCFEYINNGSLENYITDELRGLQWDTRYSIIKGICEGLQYLHVKMKIIHRDLKPANILIDNNMIARITDFGLARMEESAQTKSTTGTSTPGYTAPEYIDSREMSVKYDVYSLGIIIIELVTGSRSIPDSNNVLRRWRHRLHKLGKETPYICQQIAKVIDIGLRCQENKPYNRPSIAEIICDIEKIESTNREKSNENESTVGQISPYLEDDMLGIEPLELHFPFKINSQIACSFELTNETNACIAFSVHKTSSLSYCIQPNKGIVAPRSKYSVKITLQPLEEAPQDKDTGSFIVRSTKVKESLRNEDITEKIFIGEEGKLVDEVNLTITYKGEVPKEDVSFGSLIIPDMTNLHCTESEASPCTSNELIQFDPPELSLPFMPNKRIVFSVNVVNTTDYYVGFARYHPQTNVGVYYIQPVSEVLPPRSTQTIVVRRIPDEKVHDDMQCQDKFYLWSTLVSEDEEASDIMDWIDYEGSMELPIVYEKTSLCTSEELIKFDPPQLSFPFIPNKRVTMLRKFKIVNVTDHNVGFNICVNEDNCAWYTTEPVAGILPPQSTQAIKVRRTLKENKTEDMQCKDKVCVWNGIVTEGVKASDVTKFWNDGDKDLPVVLTKPGESS